MSILGTALTAGGSLLGSVASGLFGNHQMAKAEEYNDKIRAEDRQWALEDYERVLRDSSPASQMERLAMAGLNPNLALGHDMSTTVSMPRGPEAVQNPYNRDSPWRSLDALAMADLFSRIELNKSQANKNNAEADKSKSETEGQKIQNDINNATKQIQIDIASGNRYKIMAEGHQIDQAIVNGNLMLQKNLTLTDEQISTLIQTRFVQWAELDLKKYQIGENIKQAWRNLEIEAKNANTAATNAAANMIMAASTKARNDKLNELSVFQLGDAAIEFQKKYSEMERLKQQAQLSHENEIKYQEALKRFEENVGIPYEIIHDLIPLAPNMSRTSYDPKSGTTTTWKF